METVILFYWCLLRTKSASKPAHSFFVIIRDTFIPLAGSLNLHLLILLLLFSTLHLQHASAYRENTVPSIVFDVYCFHCLAGQECALVTFFSFIPVRWNVMPPRWNVMALFENERNLRRFYTLKTVDIMYDFLILHDPDGVICGKVVVSMCQ